MQIGVGSDRRGKRTGQRVVRLSRAATVIFKQTAPRVGSNRHLQRTNARCSIRQGKAESACLRGPGRDIVRAVGLRGVHKRHPGRRVNHNDVVGPRPARTTVAGVRVVPVQRDFLSRLQSCWGHRDAGHLQIGVGCDGRSKRTG